ncbi:HIRAN domain-containing protein [Kribbella sp. NPDC056861]|uniref:HIRAN domain-containing protein n=1 Tax=Kribbella sp. NPDC056861 TaxID=3154857 RepID=UPI00341BE94E
MGLIDRLLGRRAPESVPAAKVRPTRTHQLSGDEDLEVVGEINYQAALWASCGGTSPDRVRHRITAVLVPEPENIHDQNAIAVYIDNRVVGYLDRQTAAVYCPAVNRLMAEHDAWIALEGVIVGGGLRADGPGRLGVWLDHDPVQFGGQPPGRGTLRARTPAAATMRTGFSEAWLTDAEDDSYDLSWYDELPDGDRAAIAMLRELLAVDPDPIDRHFQFAELETRLYRCRDLYESALDEFDQACRQHDAEMEVICQAFRAKWDKVPLLETYRQMAIRQQKKKDWQACLEWADRGLSLYGADAAREDAVEDLLKRRNRAEQKLAVVQRAKPAKAPVPTAVVGQPAPAVAAVLGAGSAEFEVLVCVDCGSSFERLRVRGRKPRLCPGCRAQ